MASPGGTVGVVAASTFAPFHNQAVVNRSLELMKAREEYSGRLLRDNLPRPLHWLVNHPRLLKRVLRVMKRWEPELRIVSLDPGVCDPASSPYSPVIITVLTEESARQGARVWLRQCEAKGNPQSRDGLIFTYTDVSGLPAELYGVR